MKAIRFILGLLLISNCISAAPGFGVTGGVSLSKIHISNPKWNELSLYHLGFTLGVTSKWALSEVVDLQPSLVFSQNGVDYDNSSYNLPRTKITLNYLRLEPLMSVKLYEGIHFEIGPQFSYLLSASQYVYGNSGSISEAYKKIDLSVAAGIAFHVNENISISCRYMHGLLDINNEIEFFDPNSPYNLTIPKEYNRSFTLSVYYYFSSKG